MRYSLILAAASVLAASPAAAVVRYDFSEETHHVSFSLTRPDFVTAPFFVPAAELGSCMVVGVSGFDPCLGVDFEFHPPTGEDRIGVRYLPPGTGGGTNFYYFPAGTFGRAGVHRGRAFFDAELRITNFKDGGVPEPASWALMILGFGIAGATLRRRRLAPAA